MPNASEYPSVRPGQEDEQRRAAPSNPPRRKRRRRRRHPVLSILIWTIRILGSLLLIGVLTGCFVACYGIIYIRTVIMPEAERLDLSTIALNEPSTIYYTDKDTGQPVAYATCVGAENRIVLEPDEVPEVFKNAAIAIEDKRFYSHQGVDWIRTAAAVLYMFTGRDIQGGSTITQQVIKNYTMEDEVTVKRKVLEIFRALSVDNKYSKDEILTMYLNRIFLGSKQYGIAAASRYYFDKDVSEINVAEAASIIAITNNPSLFSPYSTVETTDSKTGAVLTGLERNKRRQELILHEMCYTSHMITESQYRAACALPLNFARGSSSSGGSEVNSWYTDRVIAELIEHFESQGYTHQAAEHIVYNGGLHIYTPFDPEVQACVDAIYSDPESLLNPRTGQPYTSKDGQQLQSCITVVDNETGCVVAMAGQLRQKTGDRWLNFATNSTRQPGSSIKPLAAYSPAIEMGLVTPYTILDDSPLMFLNEKVWPRNDNGRYLGRMSVVQGITGSTNTIATKLVGEIVGVQASFNFLQERYGITTLEEHYVTSDGRIKNDLGVSQLALGGLTKGLSPYEMTAAYATFPRGGAYVSPSVVTRVENRDHQTIWDNSPKATYPIKESTAHYMNILLTNSRIGTGGDARFSDNMHIAGKTGTTTDNYDRWFAGFTPYYTAVVWAGYEYNAYIETPGINPAAVLWGKVMGLVHEDLPDKPFFSVSDVASYSICLDCGLLATSRCTNDVRGNRTATYSFVNGTQPVDQCTCHVPISVCTESPVLNANGDPIPYLYHQAGEFCPAESVKTVCLVEYYRDQDLCAGVNVEDRYYMLSFFEGLENPDCDVHLPEEIPDDPDPDDPDHDPDGPYPDPDDPFAPWWDPDDPGGSAVSPPVSPYTPPSGVLGSARPDPSRYPEETPPPDDFAAVS